LREETARGNAGYAPMIVYAGGNLKYRAWHDTIEINGITRKESDMEKKFISDFKINEQVDSVFRLSKKNLKLTKYDKPYLEISLQDKSGRIEGRLWDNAEKYNAVIETGDIVRVKGTVDKYRDEKQLKIDFIERADDRSFRYEDMVRVAEKRDDIFNKLMLLLGTVKNEWIASLIRKFTADLDFISLFKDGIGGKAWHNAYIGGLMEHTLEVMYIADRMCKLYPQADRDLILFGAFVHDIGKVYELDPKKMEYTVEGGLLGHIAIGHKMLIDHIHEVKDFPKDLSMRLEHIILSHHGEYEQQSPVLPKTLEATIIYQVDELVSQANAVNEIIRSQEEEGKFWSNYVSIKNRKYYIKNQSKEDWNKRGKTKKNAEIEKNEGEMGKETFDLFDA
jgi:3'-5' exoribonuclease